MKTKELFLLVIALISSFLSFSQASYTTPGTYTWTVPPCVYSITVKVWGGGGGGGGAIAIVRSGDGSEACAGAGGGGGGGYSSNTYAVVPGQTYTVVVGAGGIAGIAGSGSYNSGVSTPAGPGGTGGTSSFSGNSYNLSATGGTGGTGASCWSNNLGSGACALANGAAGLGGTGSGGSVNFTGGSGAAGLILYESTDKSAGGGGAAGPGGNGGNATNPGSVGISNPPGGIGQAPGGNGGNGWVHNIPSNQNRTGNNGLPYGGAGGGALIHRGTYNVGNAPGGAGAPGAVIIEYSAPSAPADPIVSITAATCLSAGSASISNYSGSNTYSFTPSGPSVGGGGAITSATPGTAYTVTANNGSCNSNAISFTVPTQLPPPATPTIISVPATCLAAGSSSVSNYSGSNTYSFTPSGPSVGGGGVITGATPGTSYSITASSGGCTSTPANFSNAIQLPSPADPTVSITAATCSAAGSASISNYSGSNTYSFTPSGPNVGGGGAITSATPGTAYTVTANNGSCNSNAISFTVPTQLPPPATPTIISVPATCLAAGSSSVSNYSGSNTYSFTPSGPSVGGGGVITGATPGTSYSITASSGGCTSTPANFSNAIQLPSPADPTVSITAATCSAAGSASISNYSGSNTYSFTPSGPNVGGGGAITGATPGVNYSIEATSNGCSSLPVSFQTDAQLSLPNQSSSIVGTANLPCGAANQTYFVTNVPGVVYTWTYTGNATLNPNGSSVILNPIQSGGTLIVTPSNACGNGIPQTIDITINTIQLTISSIVNSCIDTATGSATVTPSNGTSPYQFSWSPNGGTSATAVGLSGGTYTVNVTDNAGCMQTIQVIIPTWQEIHPQVVATDINCISALLGAATANPTGGSSPYQYLWSTSANTQSISNLQVGNYSVHVTDANGCSADTTVSIGYSNGFSIDVTPPSATINEGDSVGLIVNVIPSGGGYSYNWSPSSTLNCSTCINPIATPTETTTYTVTVSTQVGCEVDTTITIYVNPICQELIFPNIFTPNGDKVNDLYEFDTKCLTEFTYWIVNRWGNVILKSSDLTTFWDGTIDSNPATEGVYFINYTGIKANGEPIKGQTFFHLDR